MKLLFVSTMKPMLDEFITEQTNAVLSWKQLRLKPEIIIFGDDKGVAEFCTTHGIKNVSVVKKNYKDVPLINDIITQGYGYSNDADYVIYINADIILLDDFCDTIEAFTRDFPNVKSCFLSAVRYDVRNYHLLDFAGEWRKDLEESFRGEYATPDGIDIFVHKKGNYGDMKEFAIARGYFDTWMLNYALRNFEVTVDMTSTVKIYHQHGYWYQNNKVVERNWEWNTGIKDDISFKNNLMTLLRSAPKYKYITECKYISYKDGEGVIRFKIK